MSRRCWRCGVFELAPKGRQHVAWGVSPRNTGPLEIQEPRRGDSSLARSAAAALSGLKRFLGFRHPGDDAPGYMLSPLQGWECSSTPILTVPPLLPVGGRAMGEEGRRGDEGSGCSPSSPGGRGGGWEKRAGVMRALASATTL